MASTVVKCVVEPFFTRYLREIYARVRSMTKSAHLCSQSCLLGLELRRYSMQEGVSAPDPALYIKQAFDATLKASAQSQTRRGTPPLQPSLGGILSHAMIS